jgi:hypothetical protein
MSDYRLSHSFKQKPWKEVESIFQTDNYSALIYSTQSWYSFDSGYPSGASNCFNPVSVNLTFSEYVPFEGSYH